MRWPLTAAKVAGGSMLPTLRPGDWLLIRRGARIRPGDVVIAYRPDRDDLLVIKRALHRADGGWWVEGDNPRASDDSRVFGIVPDELVVGRVVLRYWPLSRSASSLGMRSWRRAR